MTEHATYDVRYTKYQRNRSVLRKAMRRLYLSSAARKLQGPTLDFGCGIGELLARLPTGSLGLEYNRDTVEYCRSLGLNVEWYDGFEDGWMLSCLPRDARFKSMVLSHVLEHFDRPAEILGRLLAAASGLGVERVLIIVPGPAGYRSDATHRTYISKDFFKEALEGNSEWTVHSQQYFPLNIGWIGKFFVHHELQVVITRPVR